jgi:hypothetical protein
MRYHNTYHSQGHQVDRIRTSRRLQNHGYICLFIGALYLTPSLLAILSNIVNALQIPQTGPGTISWYVYGSIGLILVCTGMAVLIINLFRFRTLSFNQRVEF